MQGTHTTYPSSNNRGRKNTVNTLFKAPAFAFSKTKLAAALSATVFSAASTFVNAADLTLTPATQATTEGNTVSLTVGLQPNNEFPATGAGVCTVTGSISVAASDSTADEGSDFTIDNPNFTVSVQISEGLSITPDTINISTIDDNIVEDSEAFVVTVNNISDSCSFYGGIVVPEFSTVTIIDNDTDNGDNGDNGDSLAETSGLNQRQISVATALDQSCNVNTPPLDGGQITATRVPTQEEQDQFLAICDTLNASNDLARDLDGLSHEELISMGTLSFQGATLQAQNLSKQLRRIRQGIRGIDLTGLQLNIDGQTLSGQQLNRLLGSGAGDGELHSKWGTFLGGSIQVGEYNPSSTDEEFEFDVASLLAGVDYQLNKSIVIGAALGYTDSTADIDSNGSESELSGISLGMFGSYYYKDIYYLDSIISIGDSDYSSERNVTVGNSTTLARGDTGGNEFTFTANGGYYLHKPSYTLHLFGSINYIDATIDNFREKASNGSAGHLLAIDDQDLQSLTTNLGIELGWAINTQKAVISPQFSIDWEHQHEDDIRVVSGRFIGDITNTTVSIETEDQDRNYFNAGFTLNAVFKGGFSAYTRYEVDLERDDFDVYDFSIGGRWEL